MNPQYQRYATLTSFNSMTSNTAHDRLVKLAAQLVGEYCHLIATPPEEVVTELLKKFPSASASARAIIVSAIAKIGARYSPMRDKAVEFLDSLRGHQNIDIQQRAIEYSTILTKFPNLIPIVFKPSPPFQRESYLKRLVSAEEHNTVAPLAAEEESEEESADESALATTLPARGPAHPSANADNSESEEERPAEPEKEEDLMDGFDFAAKAKPHAQRHHPRQAPEPVAVAQPVEQETDLARIMQPSKDDDLLTVFQGAQVEPVTSAESVYKRFLTQDQGIAYEDQMVQLNLAIQVSGPNALLNFALFNKSSQSLTNVKIYLLPVPFLRQSTKPGPNTLAPQATAVYQFALSIVSPYSDPPQYIFSYNTGQTEVKETQKLPLVMTKFMTPFPMDHSTFFARWAQFLNPNQSAKATYPAPKGGDACQQLGTFMNMLLRVPVLPLQVPPGNVCGAGVVHCEGTAHGILVRFFLEQGASSVQVEVRGTSPQITSAIQKVLDAQFK
jgi:AP-2 complex subunit alpha